MTNNMFPLDEIFDAAKRRDAEKIEALQEQGVDIEEAIYADFLLSPVLRLAYDSDTIGILFLSKYARIKENHVVFGTALKGNFQWAIDYYKEHNIDPTMLAVAFVLANDHSAAEYFVKHCDGKLDSLLLFYAIIGNEEQVDRFLAIHPELFLLAALGYARGGHTNLVNALSERYEIKPAFVIFNLALGGFLEQAYAYFDQLSETEKSQVNSHRLIAAGLVKGKHFDAIEIFRINTDNLFVNDLAGAFALTGLVDKVQEYHTLHHADVNVIAQYFAIGGNMTYAEYYYQEHHASPYFIAQGLKHKGRLENYPFYKQFIQDQPPLPSLFPEVEDTWCNEGQFQEELDELLSDIPDLEAEVSSPPLMSSFRYGFFDNPVLSSAQGPVTESHSDAPRFNG